MSSFDPATVRQAVAEFTPRRPKKFQDLFPAKEVIVELRQKRASYRAIAEFLTQHCLPTSKTTIATFCHPILGESRPRCRPGHSRPVPTRDGEAICRFYLKLWTNQNQRAENPDTKSARHSYLS